MLAVIVADAPAADLSPYQTLLRRADLLIAADGGARYLPQLGHRPGLLIGDLDSIPPLLLAELEAAEVEIQRFPSEKDETDLELGLLAALSRGASHIVVLAALGGRPDQHLANLLLLAHPALREEPITMFDGAWEIQLVEGVAHIQGRSGERVSLLPLGDVHGVTTSGLRYPLNDEPLPLGPARGVSNELLGEHATVQVRDGQLLLFHERAGEIYG